MIRLDRYDWESYYRPQTKFAKVMFLHVSVRPQGGSGPRGSLVPGGVWSQGGSGPTSGGSGPGGFWSHGGACSRGSGPGGGCGDPPPGHLLLRAVHILLECILVPKYF